MPLEVVDFVRMLVDHQSFLHANRYLIQNQDKIIDPNTWGLSMIWHYLPSGVGRLLIGNNTLHRPNTLHTEQMAIFGPDDLDTYFLRKKRDVLGWQPLKRR